MLSTSHILAMNAKNLLDVIDSIRIRFPVVNDYICKRQESLSRSRNSVQDVRMRHTSRSGDVLRRSQSSERQTSMFKQSHSGEHLYRNGHSAEHQDPLVIIQNI